MSHQRPVPRLRRTAPRRLRRTTSAPPDAATATWVLVAAATATLVGAITVTDLVEADVPPPPAPVAAPAGGAGPAPATGSARAPAGDVVPAPAAGADGGAGVPVPVPQAPAGASTVAPPPVSTYTVRPGDSVAAIARLHGVTIEELAGANRLEPPFALFPGDRLLVPVPAGPATPLQPSGAEVGRVAQALRRWAEEARVPADLLAAVAWQESRWRSDVRSTRGAVGVGQLLPGTARWVADSLVGEPLDPTVLDDNLRLSATLLAWLIAEHDGDQAAAVAAYYQGPASAGTDGWYGETTRYVREVFEHRWRLRAAGW